MRKTNCFFDIVVDVCCLAENNHAAACRQSILLLLGLTSAYFNLLEPVGKRSLFHFSRSLHTIIDASSRNKQL